MPCVFCHGIAWAFLSFLCHVSAQRCDLPLWESWDLLPVAYPRARREAPAGGQRPPGEGANLNRHLVPYHGKRKRIQSRIEFIYLFIYYYYIAAFFFEKKYNTFWED